MLTRLLMMTALLASASPLLAQQYSDARVLGGTTAFYKPALTNAASLKRMAGRPGMAEDIRSVLRDAGISQVSDAVVAVMSGASSAPNVGSCSDATPADGVLVECQAQTGSTVEWMAYRPLVNGKHVPARLERVRWVGKQPYAAFFFRLTMNNTVYSFIIPKPCANLSLVSAREVARVAVAEPPPPPPVAAAPAAVVAPPPPPPPPPPPAPEPPPPAAVTTTTTATETSRVVEKPSLFFVDGLLGGERRNRPADLAEGKLTNYNQGSGLIGVRIGIAKKFESNWEIGGVFGLGAMFTFDHNTVDQWPFTLDLEVNRYFGRRVFIGSGVSIWDFTRSDTWTPAAPLRLGIAMGDHPRHPIVLLVEGRWFLDHATQLATHYQGWAGVRIHFG